MRGLDGTCLAKVKMWYKGPKSLWESESSWKRDHIIEEIDADDPETKKEVSINRIEVKTDTLETLETRFSSWNKMGRVFALVLKFKTNLLRNFFQKRDKTELHKQIGTLEQFLSNAEIEIVEKKIIKMAQSRPFAEEISLLGLAKNKKVSKVKQNSKLYSLDPFIGEDQVLHLGGRLKNASLNNSFTHPALLPKNGTITELLIRWCHEKTAHGGRDITLNETRSNEYWIIDAKSKTRQIIFKCVRYRRLRGRLEEQKMVNLPYERTTEAPSFRCCGVDKFGAFYIKEKRS